MVNVWISNIYNGFISSCILKLVCSFKGIVYTG